MRWTLGLLLIAAAGCGYRQTKMVACPETGCSNSYASSSPQGLPEPRESAVRPESSGLGLEPPVPPLAPLPEHETPPTPPPVYTPSP